MTVLVDGGATEHFLDDELVSGLKDRMKDCTLLLVLKTIVAAGHGELCGTETGILYDTIVDQTVKTHRVRFPSLIVSGPGRHSSLPP